MLFRNFGVLCFLETPVLRFTLLPYSQRKGDGGRPKQAGQTIVPLQSGSGIRKRSRKYRKQTIRGLKTLLKIGLNVIKKLVKSDAGKMIIKEGIKKAPDVYRSGEIKVKNNRIRKFLDSDIANTGVDLAGGYAI